MCVSGAALSGCNHTENISKQSSSCLCSVRFVFLHAGTPCKSARDDVQRPSTEESVPKSALWRGTPICGETHAAICRVKPRYRCKCERCDVIWRRPPEHLEGSTSRGSSVRWTLNLHAWPETCMPSHTPRRSPGDYLAVWKSGMRANRGLKASKSQSVPLTDVQSSSAGTQLSGLTYISCRNPSLIWPRGSAHRGETGHEVTYAAGTPTVRHNAEASGPSISTLEYDRQLQASFFTEGRASDYVWRLSSLVGMGVTNSVRLAFVLKD